MPSVAATPRAPRAPRPATGRFSREGNWRAAERGLRTSGVLEGRFRARAERPDADDARVLQAVQRAKAGDREALRFLYVRYADNVYGYVLSLLNDAHEAEDVTQHVFMKLMSALHKYEPRAVPFAAWVMRVARNVAIDHLRQRRQLPCEEVFGADERADDVHDDRRRCLRAALETLPEDQRNVVVLRHLVGLSPGEIADRLGKTQASVHGLHHRARLALRGELERMEAAPTAAARRRASAPRRLAVEAGAVS
jgi:RNA polymerase sigma-70 factor, ECF subfamily